jgi:hypothetical protein
MNVVTLLTHDHRTVEGLLERYRSATDEAKQALLEEIARELMKHMDAEERVLYPLLRTSILDGETSWRRRSPNTIKRRGFWRNFRARKLAVSRWTQEFQLFGKQSPTMCGKRKKASSPKCKNRWTPVFSNNSVARSRTRSVEELSRRQPTGSKTRLRQGVIPSKSRGVRWLSCEPSPRC